LPRLSGQFLTSLLPLPKAQQLIYIAGSLANRRPLMYAFEKRYRHLYVCSR